MNILEEMRQQAIDSLVDATGETCMGDVMTAIDAIQDMAREVAQEEITKAVGRIETDAREAEDRQAWTMFAAAAAGPTHVTADAAAAFADALLEERRKRWPGR